MSRSYVWHTSAAIALLLLLTATSLGGIARAETPTPADHNAHHADATPSAPAPCATPASGTPMAGDMMGGEMMGDGMMIGSPVGDMPREFDLMFIDMMIVHHQSAVAMAQVAIERADHEEVRELAREIIAAQEQEIAQMREWRDAWYPGAPAMPMDQMGAMMGEMMGGMPQMMGTPGAGMDMEGMMGMMDPHAEVQALCNAPGPFDQAFLQAMIPHHQSAVAMAQAALERTARPEIRELAQAIIAAQEQEIAQMRQWLADWYDVAMLAPTGA